MISMFALVLFEEAGALAFGLACSQQGTEEDRGSIPAPYALSA